MLGLDSGLSWPRAGGASSGEPFSTAGGVLADTILEMLPETECPGLAVAVLDVSLEISDSGRGINSTVSEKPTLERLADVDGPGVRSTGLKPGIGSTAAGRSGVRCSG